MEAPLTMATAVKPSDIHSALSRLWETLEGTGKMRASLFNLIVYAEEGPRAEYTQKIAHTVIEKFPARVILIRTSKSEGLVTKISLLSPHGKEMDVACDLIEIQVSPNEKMRVPFIVLPHLLPDLPIYFLWGSDPSTGDPLFLELERFATRLIFDSECSSSLSEFAKTLLNHYKNSSADIADLNWARCESWRNLFSSVFYSEEKLDDLKKAEKIEIHYNAAQTSSFCHTQIQALYFQAWLTVQLGWKKDQVEFKLIPSEKKNLAPGLIASVDVCTKDDRHYAFTLEPSLPQKIVATFSSKELCGLPEQFLFPRGEKGQSLVSEICHRGTSSHYLRVLELLQGKC